MGGDQGGPRTVGRPSVVAALRSLVEGWAQEDRSVMRRPPEEGQKRPWQLYKRHDLVVAAARAPHMQAAAGEQTASEVRPELVLHERGESTAITGLGLGEQLVEGWLDHAMEDRTLRDTPGVRCRRGARQRHRRGVSQDGGPTARAGVVFEPGGTWRAPSGTAMPAAWPR